jgi:hypothetical protein
MTQFGELLSVAYLRSYWAYAVNEAVIKKNEIKNLDISLI